MASYEDMFSDHISQTSIEDGLATSLLGRRVVYLPTTTSTMDEAKKAALGGAPEGTLVLADEQTQGRGRFQRTWVSPPGVNLYFSLVLRPAPEEASQLSMLASLAVARALRSLAPGVAQITIKWPNDVRIGGKKIGGILIENALADEERQRFSIVGVGLNVNLEPTEYADIRDIATSLRQELGHPVPRLDVLSAVLEEMEGLYLAIQRGGSVREEWSSLLDTLGHQVRVAWGEQVFEGHALGVDEEGSLLLRQTDGSLQTLAAGEVTLRT